jgi:hypothetical protein
LINLVLFDSLVYHEPLVAVNICGTLNDVALSIACAETSLVYGKYFELAMFDQHIGNNSFSLNIGTVPMQIKDNTAALMTFRHRVPV